MTEIVIVDERRANRTAVADMLVGFGEDLCIRQFEDPADALEGMTRVAPDLLITGFSFPSGDVDQLISGLRAIPECFDVPVFVLSDRDDVEARYFSLEAGANDYMQRPVDQVEFSARVRNMLALRMQHSILKQAVGRLEDKLLQSDRLRRRELSESEEKLRLVTNTVPAMISATDRYGRCVMMNSYQCAFFGLDQHTLAGAPIDQLCGEDYGTRHRELDLEVLTHGDTRGGFEETLADRNGTPHVFLTTKAPVCDLTGSVVNVVTVSLDISERKNAEWALFEAKEDAEAANRTKTDFLANMSHELRTPLNAIIGFADIMKVELLGPIGNPRYREYATDILASAHHLLGLMNDMLDVSRIEAGRMELEETNVDVQSTIDDVIHLVKGRAEDVGVTVKASPARGLPLLRADELRVKQILLNLVSNGVKFTPPGGSVTLSADTTEAGGIKISVTDTGIGIRDEDVPTAVERFGRVEHASVTRSPGTGLGLPLAIDLMRLHGGSLDITSGMGSGTTMTIAFPSERSIREERRA